MNPWSDAVTFCLGFMTSVLIAIFLWACLVGREVRRRKRGPVTPPPYIERQKRQ